MTESHLISVATSLVPGRDIDLQSSAMRSWQAQGFRVTALNSESEIGFVRQQFPNVVAVVTQRTAQKAVGKPLPFIVDLLKTATAQDPTSRVIGFLNSDILLRTQCDLTRALLEHATSSAVLIPRIDIADIKSAETFSPTGTEKYSIGYDGIFLPPHMLASIPDSLFCIGMPFWDYWLPLILILQGHSVKTIASPVALHVHHDTRWDQSIYLFFHALMSDTLKICADQKVKAQTPALEIVTDLLQHSYQDIFQRATQTNADSAAIDSLAAFYDRIQEVIVHHIKAKAIPLHVPDLLIRTP